VKQLYSFLEKIVEWRNQHIKQRPFIMMMSVLIGITSGLIAAIIKRSVHYTEYFLTHFFSPYTPNYLYFLYPMLGIGITALIAKYIIRQKVNEGIPNTLYSLSKRRGNIRPHYLFSSIITSAFTVGFGGSVGLEGPTVATAAGWGSNFGRLFKVDYKTKSLLIATGVAGSMAAIFQAPIAAIVFAVEVIMIDLTTASLVPLLFASISAILTSKYLLGEAILIHYDLEGVYLLKDVPMFILLGLLLGLGSAYYTGAYFAFAKFLERFSSVNKVLVGGLLLGALVFILPPLYGEGFETINRLINGEVSQVFENSFFYEMQDNLWIFIGFLVALFFVKIIAASITLHAGGVGGIFAPTLFMGAVGGFVFSKLANALGWVNVSEGNFTLVGMAGMLAGVLHAPLTAIFLIAEISKGYSLFVPLMITSLISFVTVRLFHDHSIYTLQLAKRGELMTHNKDQNVLKMMSLKSEIEVNFSVVSPEMSLAELIPIVSKAKRNVFPVIDENGNFKGSVTLDNIRMDMFNTEKYESMFVHDYMVYPRMTIDLDNSMEDVVDQFEKSGAWNLVVLDGEKYLGFVSKSKVFTVYRSLLKEFSDH
jgi:CIC family chloride channel protein